MPTSLHTRIQAAMSLKTVFMLSQGIVAILGSAHSHFPRTGELDSMREGNA
jgi:hypothetical protein